MTLLDYSDLQAKGIKFTKASIWRLVKQGVFPQPVKPGTGRNAWIADEIDEYLERIAAARIPENAA